MSALISLFCQIANGAGGSCAATSAIISGTDIDWTVADHRFKTLSGSTVFTFSNVTEAKTISVYITNPGAFTVTFPVTVLWPGNVAPIQTVPIGSTRTDIYTFVMVNGILRGSYIQNYTP